MNDILSRYYIKEALVQEIVIDLRLVCYVFSTEITDDSFLASDVLFSNRVKH